MRKGINQYSSFNNNTGFHVHKCERILQSIEKLYIHFNLNAYCLGIDPGTLLFVPIVPEFKFEAPPNPLTINYYLPTKILVPKMLFFPLADSGLSLP